MYQIPVNSAPYQEQTFHFDKHILRLTLRFNSVGQFWAMDVFDVAQQRFICQGTSLAVDIPLLWRGNQPYFFYVSDESGTGLDPMSPSDLGNRCLLFVEHKIEVVNATVR